MFILTYINALHQNDQAVQEKRHVKSNIYAFI